MSEAESVPPPEAVEAASQPQKKETILMKAEDLLYKFTHGKEIQEAKEEIARAEGLLSRINIDAAVDSEAVLSEFAREMTKVRTIVKMQKEGRTDSVGAINTVGLASIVRYHERNWQQRGLLNQEPDPDYQADFGSVTAETRADLLGGLDNSLASVNPSFLRFHGAEGSPVSFADQVIDLKQALSYDEREQDPHDIFVELGVEKADIDPRFLGAIKAKAESLFNGQREAVYQYAKEQATNGGHGDNPEILESWARDTALNIVPELNWESKPNFDQPAETV